MLKRLTLIYFFLVASFIQMWACSCFPVAESFCETVVEDNSLDLVVKAVKTADVYYGMEVEIVEVLLGEETRTNITVWGDNGALCRVFTEDFEIGEALYLALHTTDFGGNLIPNFNYPLDLEQEGDYVLSVCGKYFEYETTSDPASSISVDDDCGMLSTDTEDAVFEQVNIYPNPVTDRLNITTVNPLETIKVFDAMGSLIKEQTATVGTHTLDLSDLKNGVYFVILSDGKKEEARKIVVQK